MGAGHPTYLLGSIYLRTYVPTYLPVEEEEGANDGWEQVTAEQATKYNVCPLNSQAALDDGICYALSGKAVYVYAYAYVYAYVYEQPGGQRRRYLLRSVR